MAVVIIQYGIGMKTDPQVNEYSETDPLVYNQLIFVKGARNR